MSVDSLDGILPNEVYHINSLLDGKALMTRPNGLGISRAAPIDRESCRANTSLQNSNDLARR
jgi:hypothetical protein